ncbi:MAG: type II secretion system GspH family protein [Lentisphaerales bacterium]|nr:type II secretion system GspH family protein [Lentisphaerales bacterium]
MVAVIAIIGILFSILFPSLQGSRDKARSSVCLS